MGELIHSKVIEEDGRHIICLKIKGDKDDVYESLSINWEDCDTIGEVLETMIKESDGASEEDSLINEIVKKSKIEKESIERAYV